MKIAIFVEQFPALSQTFVLKQVTSLIDLGFDVSILSIHCPKKMDIMHKNFVDYGLQGKTQYLTPSYSSTIQKFLQRLRCLFEGGASFKTLPTVLRALNLKRFNHHARSGLLLSIAANEKNYKQYDVVICHFGTTGVIANKLKQLGVINGKIVTIFHGFELSMHNVLKKNDSDYKNLFSQTDLMLPVSDKWKEKLISLGCPPDKIQVNRVGIDLKEFAYQHPRHTTSALKIFTVARFTEKKGLDIALRALAIVKQKVNFEYILAGSGELEATLKQLVKDLGLCKHVSFIGAISQEEVVKYISSSDIFLQPSITASNGDMEGVPVALMEAMALGTPVISTFHSGIPELISNNLHGLLAPERNVDVLAQCLITLMEEDKLREKLAKNARIQVENIADLKNNNRKLISILRKLK
ncbi:glycosyltransferase [Flocculibacter collagenilyticus]|uniref:glycosyltransferase n=1 Tax=Flocculibacter collagenilyticus TaxID=2744479 RepID=UPI0018F2C520|nr:glycosyltransferase [Flocculibacter collagenilyticus]